MFILIDSDIKIGGKEWRRILNLNFERLGII